VAEQHRVRCVVTIDGVDREARIAKIGGTNAVGVNWRLSQQEAVSAIEEGRWAFFVVRRTGEALEVVVETSSSGRKYLTTGQAQDPDPLLGLPACD
jgi:hypothetical protein